MFARKTVAALIAIALWAIVTGVPEARAQLAQTNLAAAPRSLSVIVETHQQLWIRFHELWDAIQKSGGAEEDRRNFVIFIQRDVLDQLHREGVSVYLAFDSLLAGGYASVAALYDREAIARLAKTLDYEVDSKSFGVFGERTFALTQALQSYMRKTDELILPVIQARLSPPAIQTVLDRLEN